MSEGGAAVQFKYSYWTKFNDEAWNGSGDIEGVFSSKYLTISSEWVDEEKKDRCELSASAGGTSLCMPRMPKRVPSVCQICAEVGRMPVKLHICKGFTVSPE